MLKQNEVLYPEQPPSLEQKRQFLKLSLTERRRILLKQAEEAAHHYEAEDNIADREYWQGGDIVNY